jgi:hypothetical protein
MRNLAWSARYHMVPRQGLMVVAPRSTSTAVSACLGTFLASSPCLFPPGATTINNGIRLDGTASRHQLRCVHCLPNQCITTLALGLKARCHLLHQAWGNVLEIGVGTGLHLPFYHMSKFRWRQWIFGITHHNPQHVTHHENFRISVHH